MKKIIIVDENDEVIGSKERDSLEIEDMYRVSSLWITNSRGEVLIAQRHRTKTHNPLAWGPAVSGTLEEGETYDSNILKEAWEELGLKDVRPELGPKLKLELDYNFFAQFYFLQIDKEISEFKIQENEVEQVKWISKEDLRREIETNPEKFTSGMAQVYGKLFLG